MTKEIQIDTDYKQVLDDIRMEMSGKEWTADTWEAVAQRLRRAGFAVRNYTPLEKYEVVLLNDETKNRWTMMFQAEDFAHAEEQAVDTIETNGGDDEIISINKEYGD